jgi:hypothetical protein
LPNLQNPNGTALIRFSCENSGRSKEQAGVHLSRPNSIHQCVDRALIPSGQPPKCLLHSADLPYVQTPKSNPVSVTSTSSSAATLNPHSARCSDSAGAQLPATSCLGAFWTPVRCACGASLLPASRNQHRSRLGWSEANRRALSRGEIKSVRLSENGRRTELTVWHPRHSLQERNGRSGSCRFYIDGQ